MIRESTSRTGKETFDDEEETKTAYSKADVNLELGNTVGYEPSIEPENSAMTPAPLIEINSEKPAALEALGQAELWDLLSNEKILELIDKYFDKNEAYFVCRRLTVSWCEKKNEQFVESSRKSLRLGLFSDNKEELRVFAPNAECMSIKTLTN